MTTPDAEPFFFPAGDRAILCVHGFTGSPYEVRFLGERLAAAGYTVLGIRLPGHRAPEELEETELEEWRSAVGRAVTELGRAPGIRGPIGIAGLSMGGALSLDAAARFGARIGAVSIFGTPVYLAGSLHSLLDTAQRIGLHRFLRFVPKIAGSDIADEEQRRKNPTMMKTPVAAAYQLCRLLELVRAELPSVRQPLLLAHGMRDRTVPPSNLGFIASRVTSREVEVWRYPRSRHLITIDLDREAVAARTIEFFHKHLGPPTKAEVSLPEGVYA